MIYELSVAHGLVFTQQVKTKPERRSLRSTLYFTQTIHHNIRTRKLTSQLALSQSVRLRTSVYHLSVTHTLNFTQVAAKNPVYLNVNHLLFHWQTIKRPKWEKVTSFFSPAQTVVGNGCHGVKSDLRFNQTVVGNVVRNFTITHNTGFVSGVSAWLMDPNFNYLSPVFTVIPQVRFDYNGTERYFRKPEFDDTYTYDLTKINRRSRGGDLIIGRDPIWPATKTLNLRWTYLSQADVDWLLNFMKLTLGKRCRYLNYDNVQWSGFIMNPQTAAQQIGRGNHAVTIEFEGEPL